LNTCLEQLSSLAPLHTGEHKIRIRLNKYSNVVGKPEGKVQFGRPGCRMEYDRQCTYNVTLKGVRIHLLPCKSRKYSYYVFWVSLC